MLVPRNAGFSLLSDDVAVGGTKLDKQCGALF
jgi:hypothetical protein